MLLYADQRLTSTSAGGMVPRLLTPKGIGTVLLDAHPTGCARTVAEMALEVPTGASRPTTRPIILAIGCSAGYGLAATIAGILGSNASGSACVTNDPRVHAAPRPQGGTEPELSRNSQLQTAQTSSG